MSEAQSALAGASREGMVRVREAGLHGMITLRGDLGSAKVKTAVKDAAGLDVPAQRKIVSEGETAVAWMSPDELLLGVRIPKHTGWGAHYEKFVRVAHQWPIVAVAATVKADGGSVSQARIGLTNMGNRPLRAAATEAALAGAAATEDGVRAACDQAAEGTSPPSDLNGDAGYRQHLAKVLTRRAVLKAAGVDVEGHSGGAV